MIYLSLIHWSQGSFSVSRYEKHADQISLNLLRLLFPKERVKRYLEEVTFRMKHKREDHYSLESNSCVSCKYGFAEQVTKSASKRIVVFMATDWSSVGRRKSSVIFSFNSFSANRAVSIACTYTMRLAGNLQSIFNQWEPY